MNPKEPGLFPFALEPIAAFDARRGYRRHKVPGVGVHLADGRRADADIWRGRSGNVVVRLSSQGCVSSFAVVGRAGRSPQGDEIKGLEEYLTDVLFLWLIDGVDDEPTSVITRRRAALLPR
jgi:hypothetical protein